jgi:UDP-GlcNAc:undecaprenyl-phosphate GlcNAc-1-phosphate transferase
MFINIIFLPLAISLLATLAITPLVIKYMKKLKIVDDPKKRDHPAIIHKKPVPRGGGIAIFFGVIIASLIFLPVSKITISLFLGSFLALVVGVLDDKYDLSPYLRFFLNIVSAAIVVYGGISIPFVTNPFGGTFNLNTIGFPIEILGFNFMILLSDLVSIIWFVWVMNMLNWSKGVDGQMPGILVISAIVIGLLSLRFPVINQTDIISAKLSFILAGASLGFLFFNYYPAKIFPGYGATSIYFLLAAVSIISSVKLATAILVLGVPMIDGAITIIRRILSGKSPFWHDKKHLHHLLLYMGLGQRRVALFYWTISAVLGTLSLFLSSRGKLFAVIMVIIIIGGFLLFLHFALEKKNENTL